MTSRAEGIQIEERSMTLEICIAINNEEGAPSYAARLSQLHNNAMRSSIPASSQIPWVDFVQEEGILKSIIVAIFLILSNIIIPTTSYFSSYVSIFILLYRQFLNE